MLVVAALAVILLVTDAQRLLFMQAFADDFARFLGDDESHQVIDAVLGVNF